MKFRRNLRPPMENRTIDPDVFPVLPIVELAGNSRVLIENHFGVTAYCLSQVNVKMKYGQVQVCGSSLMLEHMSRAKLVITGRIDGITLIRREEK